MTITRFFRKLFRRCYTVSVTAYWWGDLVISVPLFTGSVMILSGSMWKGWQGFEGVTIIKTWYYTTVLSWGGVSVRVLRVCCFLSLCHLSGSCWGGRALWSSRVCGLLNICVFFCVCVFSLVRLLCLKLCLLCWRTMFSNKEDEPREKTHRVWEALIHVMTTRHGHLSRNRPSGIDRSNRRTRERAQMLPSPHPRRIVV